MSGTAAGPPGSLLRRRLLECRVTARTPCVLLVPKGGRPSERGRQLQVLLDERGWEAHESNDPLLALAELCLLDRMRASQRSWGHGDDGTPALVVVQPAGWPGIDFMVAAARRYVPGAGVWSYDAGSLDELAPDPQQRPRTRAKTNRSPSAVEVPLVSPEEIDMLLEDPDRDPSP